MNHYLNKFVNCKITIIREVKDPDVVDPFGPVESGPSELYQDISCYISRKNGSVGYVNGKYISESDYQILLKKELLDANKLINIETDTINVIEYAGSATHTLTGKYRIVDYDPERGRTVRPDLHAKFFLSRSKSIDES